MLANKIFDCHTHTHFSHDSECDPYDSLKAAKERQIAGFAITAAILNFAVTGM